MEVTSADIEKSYTRTALLKTVQLVQQLLRVGHTIGACLVEVRFEAVRITLAEGGLWLRAAASPPA